MLLLFTTIEESQWRDFRPHYRLLDTLRVQNKQSINEGWRVLVRTLRGAEEPLMKGHPDERPP